MKTLRTSAETLLCALLGLVIGCVLFWGLCRDFEAAETAIPVTDARILNLPARP